MQKRKPKWKVRVVTERDPQALRLDLVKELYNKIREFSKIAKGLKHKSPEWTMISSAITNMRHDYSTVAFEYYVLSGSLGSRKFVDRFYTFPTGQDIKLFMDTRLAELQAERKRNKQPPLTENREYLGIPYKVTGGTFSNPNSVLNIKANSNPLNRIDRNKIPHKAIRSHYIGVELELLVTCAIEDVKSALCKAKMEGYVHVGTDGSVTDNTGRGRGIEVRVLCKQEDAHYVISRVCDTLKAECGGFVNDTCGLHVHFDMRSRDIAHCYNNMVYALPTLSAMVPSTRLGSWGGRYCKLNEDPEFKRAETEGNRYQAINPESYRKLKTLEVRLHSGSLNTTKICNWIKTNILILEHKELLTSKVVPAKFAEVFSPSPKLKEFVDKRVSQFAKETITTSEDEKKNIEYEAVS